MPDEVDVPFVPGATKRSPFAPEQTEEPTVEAEVDHTETVAEVDPSAAEKPSRGARSAK